MASTKRSISLKLIPTAIFVVLILKDNPLVSSSTHRNLQVKIQDPVVLPDGTMVVSRRSNIQACDYFVGRRNHPEDIASSPHNITSIRFHFEDCSEHQLGNRLGEHYQRYLLASAARLPYRMTCGDENDNSTQQRINLNRKGVFQESVLKHLSGDYGVPMEPLDIQTGQIMSITDVCRNCGGAGWDSQRGPEALHGVFRDDMRRLAYHTDVGASVEPEDAVIHLRLGDALKGNNDQRIGLLPHRAYADILEQTVSQKGEIQTIGLVTQPFQKELVRRFDAANATLDKSRAVARDLQRYLHEKFPSCTIKIHNDGEETPLRSFARLIKAKKVSVCGSSTFCTYPVLSVVDGLGFIYKTDRHSPWAPRLAGLIPSIRSYLVPRLANNFTAILEIPQILYWLRNQDLRGDVVINQEPLIRNLGEGNLTSLEVLQRLDPTELVA